MNVSFNPIQYQLQLFGVNAAQTGTGLNAANSDPFGMAISAVGATVVPEVQDANGSGGSTTGDNSYRSWAQSTQSYKEAAQAGSQAPADSGDSSPASTGTDEGQSTAPAASDETAGAGTGDTGNGDAGTTTNTETGASSTGNTQTSGGSSNGSSTAESGNGGLFGLFRR